ncbi:MAG: guanylate kinase [Eubacteriales bacterium]
MTVPGLLIVISGPSGTGKGTICKSLFQRRPEIFFSISATTRPPRAGEIEGVNYYFKDKKSFEEMLDRNEFLEWAMVYDNYYGTPKTPVIEAMASGKDVVLEIDVQGALKVREKAPEGIYLFVVPPSLRQLRARIERRGTDSMEVINKRMDKALVELANLYEYNYVIVNDLVEEAVDRVESILKAEKCTVQRYRFVVDGEPDEPLVVPK